MSDNEDNDNSTEETEIVFDIELSESSNLVESIMNNLIQDTVREIRQMDNEVNLFNEYMNFVSSAAPPVPQPSNNLTHPLEIPEPPEETQTDRQTDIPGQANILPQRRRRNAIDYRNIRNLRWLRDISNANGAEGNINFRIPPRRTGNLRYNNQLANLLNYYNIDAPARTGNLRSSNYSLPRRPRLVYNSRSNNAGTFSFSMESNLNNMIDASLNNDENRYKKVLSEKGQDKLKTVKYSKEIHGEQPMCMVSLSEFEEGEEITELPCKHIFKTGDIKKWLVEEDASCPICRHELPSKEVLRRPRRNRQNVPDVQDVSSATATATDTSDPMTHIERSIFNSYLHRQQVQEEMNLQRALRESRLEYERNLTRQENVNETETEENVNLSNDTDEDMPDLAPMSDTESIESMENVD